MGGGEALGDLERVVHGLLLRDRTGVELPAQRLAFQKLHDGVGRPLVRPEVEDREDVRMRERRDRLRLALEPRQRVGIRGRRDWGRTLTATSRSSFVSRARYTSPIPPAPRGAQDLVGAEPGPG